MGYKKAEQGQETVFETDPEKVPSQYWPVFAVFSPVVLLALMVGWWLVLAFLFVIWVVAWMILNSKNSQAYRSAAKFAVRPEGITLNGQFLKTPDIHRVLIRNRAQGAGSEGRRAGVEAAEIVTEDGEAIMPGTLCVRIVVVMGLLMASLGAQAVDKGSDKADNAEISVNRDQVMQALKSMPYAEEGEGPTIYVIAYSACPHARRFENDWHGKLGNVKMRYVLYGIDDRTASEAAELALTRDPADFHRFMAGTKSAPAVRSTDRRIDAFNSVVNPLKEILQPALKANRYKERITSPHFFYTDGRRLLTQGGYSRESFADILKTAQTGYAKAMQREPIGPDSMK